MFIILIGMLFQIQIGNQVLSISQVKEVLQFQLELVNLFNRKKYEGVTRILDKDSFPIFVKLLSQSNSQEYKIVYDSPTSISLIFERKQREIFKLEEIIQEMNQKEQQWKIQSQSIFDYQNIPQEISLQIKRYPYTSMAQITSKFLIDEKLKMGLAKGFLVSPYLVITCAHSLYYRNIQAVSIQVSFPSISDQMFKASRWFFPEQYRQLPFNPQDFNGYRYDYALIFLEKRIDHQPIQMMINIDKQSILASIAGNQFKKNTIKGQGFKRKQKINVIHGDPQFGIQKTKKQYCFKQSYNYADLKKDEDLIYHTVSTQKGLSGSQMFIELNQDQYYAIGIHVAAYNFNKQNAGNVAVRFNDRIMKQFQQWEQRLIQQTESVRLKRKLDRYRIQFLQYRDHNESEKDKGFALRDYQNEINCLKKQADQLKQNGHMQMALKRRKKIFDHHKIYKNADIAQFVSNQLTLFTQQSVQLYRLKQKMADEHFKQAGQKSNYNHKTIYKKVHKEIAESAGLVDKTNAKYELQVIIRQFQRLRLQFHKQNQNYKKHQIFEKMISKIQKNQQLLDYKYQQIQAAQLKNDFLKLKSKAHYYLGICFSDKKKRKMAKSYEQFIIAKNILNKVQQSDVDEHLKICSQILNLCIRQQQKIEYKFEECFKQGVECIRFVIDKAHQGKEKAEEYLDLSSQFIHFMVNIKNEDIVVAITAILTGYKNSKVKSVRQFTQKTFKLLSLKP